jgi:excisionase family DNA binding protein
MITLNGKDYYTTKEVAKKLNKHLRTIQGWVRDKKLIPYKFGPKRFYYTDDSIEKCLKGIL